MIFIDGYPSMNIIVAFPSMIFIDGYPSMDIQFFEIQFFEETMKNHKKTMKKH